MKKFICFSCLDDDPCILFADSKSGDPEGCPYVKRDYRWQGIEDEDADETTQ